MPDSAWLQGVLRKAVAAIIGFMLAFVLLVALLITGFYMLVNATTLPVGVIGLPRHQSMLSGSSSVTTRWKPPLRRSRSVWWSRATLA